MSSFIIIIISDAADTFSVISWQKYTSVTQVGLYINPMIIKNRVTILGLLLGYSLVQTHPRDNNRVPPQSLATSMPSETWWRHQIYTFSVLLTFCAGNSEGNSTVTGEFPSQRPVTRNFDIFFDLRLNQRLGKQAWGWWFETPSCSLWLRAMVNWHPYCLPGAPLLIWMKLNK